MTYATSGCTLVVSILIPVLAVIVVALRFYSRVAHNTPASWDDWLIVPATVWQAVYRIIIPAMLSLVLQVLTVALGGIMIWGESLLVFAELFPTLNMLGVVDDGLGRPTPTAKTPGAENQKVLVTKVSLPVTTQFDPMSSSLKFQPLQVEYIFLCLELLGFGLVKLSVIFFCRRIFCNVFKNKFDIITKVLITLVVVWSVGFTFAMIFECGINFWALFSTAENLVKHCAKTLKLAEAFVISDATTDLMILCLPLPMVCLQIQ